MYMKLDTGGGGGWGSLGRVPGCWSWEAQTAAAAAGVSCLPLHGVIPFTLQFQMGAEAGFNLGLS